jgi:uncharacterized protein
MDFKSAQCPLRARFALRFPRPAYEYVRDEFGRDGIWFMSIDVPSLINAAGGRILGIPYHLADMEVQHLDKSTAYRCSRRFGPAAGHHIIVAPAGELPPEETALADRLGGRWRAFSRRGHLIEVPVEHQAWTMKAARVIQLGQTIIDAAGLAPPAGEPLAHFSAAAIHARLGRPRIVRATGWRGRP